MQIEAAVFGRVENRLRQQQAIGRDDGDIGVQGGEGRRLFRAAQTLRRADREAEPLREKMDGGFLRGHPTSRRTRRLRIDRNHLMSPRANFPEKGGREIGRAHEDDPQTLAQSSGPGFFRLTLGLGPALRGDLLIQPRRLGEFMNHALALQARQMVDEETAF
jgi:hypothetical protein